MIKINKYYFLIFIAYFISCKAQNRMAYTELKSKMGEILLSKNYIQQNEFESKKGYLVYGLHQRKISNNIKNGVYGVSTGSHRPVNFFIYDNKKVSFLDVYTFDNLLKSLDTLISYSIHKKYCRELTFDYTKRLIGVHYNINKNLRNHGDKNCKILNTMICSDYDISEIKEKMAKEISHQENINQELIELEDIYIGYLDICYGAFLENERLNDGIYTYSYIESQDFKTHYLILNGNEIQYLGMENDGAFIKSIQEVLQFNDDKGTCSEKTVWIIEQLFNSYFEDSCLSNIAKDLP